MASKFTPEVRATLLEAFAAGCSVADAARAAELREPTLKGWMTRGRAEDSGEYAEFVAAIDSARADVAAKVQPGSADELAVEVWRSVRRGSVAAMKLYWDILRAGQEPDDESEPADPFEEFDELAARRASA